MTGEVYKRNSVKFPGEWPEQILGWISEEMQRTPKEIERGFLKKKVLKDYLVYRRKRRIPRAAPERLTR